MTTIREVHLVRESVCSVFVIGKTSSSIPNLIVREVNTTSTDEVIRLVELEIYCEHVYIGPTVNTPFTPLERPENVVFFNLTQNSVVSFDLSH